MELRTFLGFFVTLGRDEHILEGPTKVRLHSEGYDNTKVPYPDNPTAASAVFGNPPKVKQSLQLAGRDMRPEMSGPTDAHYLFH